MDRWKKPAAVLFLPFIIFFVSTVVAGQGAHGRLISTPIDSEWTSVTPPVVGNQDHFLSDVYFISPDEGWAVGFTDYFNTGSKGVLHHYSNGSWTSVLPPYVSDDWSLNSVRFTSSDEGWAVGTDQGNRRGVLLHYANGSWTSVPPPGPHSGWGLYGVHFTSPEEGWAVGEDWSEGIFSHRGVLLHYSKGLWTRVDPPAVSPYWGLRRVQFTSPGEGWAVGTNGALLHYSDGSWTSVVASGGDLYSVQFTSPYEGWAAGGDGFGKGILLHYQNGYWTSVTVPYPSSHWDRTLLDVHFTSSEEGWAIGRDDNLVVWPYRNKGVLLHYANGSWKPVTLPIVSPSWNLNALHFTSSHEGWAVGKDDSRALIFYYSNGSWKSVTPPNGSSDWALRKVQFSSPDEGWAVGHSWVNHTVGILLHYLNGSWMPMELPQIGLDEWELYDVHFASPNEGWAVGSLTNVFNMKGVLLHFLNGTWTSISPPYVSPGYSWGLSSLHFTSPDDGWAVGWANEKGALLRYSNDSWTSVTPPDVGSRWGLRGVHFTSPDEGWAVGEDFSEGISNRKGVLLHYLNGSWTSVTPPYVSSDWRLNSVHFTSPDEGWAAGGDSFSGKVVLLHYSKGLWISIAPPPDVASESGLQSVCFPTPDEGWAVGEDCTKDIFRCKGVLLHYLKGSWAPVTLSDVSDDLGLYGIHFPSPNDGWAVGSDGANNRGALLQYFRASDETIVRPSTPVGPANAITGLSYTYSTEGSFSSDSHPVQYLFDWGDGTDSGWLPVGTTQASKSWTTLAPHDVKARARCSVHTSIQSDWSDALSVTIFGISIASPYGGETWKTGTSQRVQWNYSGTPGAYVKIELLKGGVFKKKIASAANIGPYGSGYYNWKIPKSLTPGGDYKIRVTSTTDPSYTDVSGNSFTIIK